MINDRNIQKAHQTCIVHECNYFWIIEIKSFLWEAFNKKINCVGIFQKGVGVWEHSTLNKKCGIMGGGILCPFWAIFEKKS